MKMRLGDPETVVPPAPRWMTLTWVYLVVLFVALLIGSPAAYPHDPSTAKTPTEAVVFDFYHTWMRPPGRTMSCCGPNDCRVVRVKHTEDDRWYFRDPQQQLWREIPDDRIEGNRPDARESPDGQSHVCYNSAFVLCAVLGSGQ